MFSVLFYMFISRIYIPNEIILWIILIASVRSISIGVILYKYKTFAMLHTYGNKITGFLLFLTPLMLSFMSVTITSIVLCLAAILSSLDELIINLKSKKFSVNRKSIFSDETL
jgi:CDP-diacylglycerol--glycerol-3-phosphate 3-phosphatidyltransferase